MKLLYARGYRYPSRGGGLVLGDSFVYACTTVVGSGQRDKSTCADGSIRIIHSEPCIRPLYPIMLGGTNRSGEKCHLQGLCSFGFLRGFMP